MFVFLEAMRKPEEQAQRAEVGNISTTILSFHEKVGLEVLSQLRSSLSSSNLSNEPITKELGGTPQPEVHIDFDQLANFNTYRIEAIDHPQVADTQKIGEAMENPERFTILVIPNPQWEENNKLADAAYNSRSPDYSKLEKRSKGTPRTIFIIKNEKTGKTIVSSQEPSFISKGKLGYGKYEGKFTYDGEKLPAGQSLFNIKTIEGQSVPYGSESVFAEKCNITLNKPKEADMDKFESVESGGKTFYVRKSAEFVGKDMSEGIRKDIMK